MQGKTRLVALGILAIGVLTAGCATQSRITEANEPVRLEDVTTADAVHAAETVLVLAHFEIEKADATHGVVRTRPLRAAQVFELWRQDDSTTPDILQADIQTLRKWVEIEFKPAGEQLAVNCRVRVQQLSIPEAGTASVSHAYQMHSRSTATTQTLNLTPRQKREAAWIDLPDDSILAQRIVERIADKLQP